LIESLSLKLIIIVSSFKRSLISLQKNYINFCYSHERFGRS